MVRDRDLTLEIINGSQPLGIECQLVFVCPQNGQEVLKLKTLGPDSILPR